MANDSKFVSVLKTADFRLVDLVAAAFDAEGITYQHPGRNHAALLPGMRYVEIDLRVQQEHLEQARASVTQLRTPHVEPGPRVAFCVRRTYAVFGTLVGIGTGVVVMVLHFPGATELVRTAVIGSPILGGYALGRSIVRRSCSLPGCRAKLDAFTVYCRKCGAEIRGEISSARQHFAALEK